MSNTRLLADSAIPPAERPVVDCVAPDRNAAELEDLRRWLAASRHGVRRTSEHFALLAGETRLKILVLLRHAGELCVCDLATVLDMTPAAVSQHLARLRSGGLVIGRRDGMTTFYRCTQASHRIPALPVLAVRED